MSEVKTEEKVVGRNEPCPCGSGKKYKRCHGVSAAPILGTPKFAPEAGASPQLPPGFDPSQMDPEWMAQFQRALQRLPRGQMQRLQSLMQKAMAGKDVSREAAEFEKSLPPELHDMVKSGGFGALTGGGMPGLPAPEAEPTMTAEEARKIVEAAAAEGKISSDEAAGLLKEAPEGSKSSFWKKITGKK